MNDCQRYRHNEAECLLAAAMTNDPHYRALYTSIAASWRTLACQDETTNNLLVRWGLGDAIVEDFEHVNDVASFPKPINHASGHRNNYLERPIDTAKVVLPFVKRDRKQPNTRPVATVR